MRSCMFIQVFRRRSLLRGHRGSSSSLRSQQDVLSLQAAAQRPANTGVQRDSAPTLAVNTKNLIGDNEMKRIFGASVLAEEARGATPPSSSPLPPPLQSLAPRFPSSTTNTLPEKQWNMLEAARAGMLIQLPYQRHTRLASNHHAMRPLTPSARLACRPQRALAEGCGEAGAAAVAFR